MVSKAKLCISGIGFWHRIWLEILTRKAVKPLSESVSVVFQDKIKAHRYSSLWYGGKVVVIRYKEYQFLLEATGDVYANLLDQADDDRSLFYVKDKNNRGLIANELLPYIKTDKELYAAMNGTHKRYFLELDYSNWWECFLVDSEGNFHDLMMALDSDGVLEAVAEILAEMDETIEYSKN